MNAGKHIQEIKTRHGTFFVDGVRDAKMAQALASSSYHQQETLDLLGLLVTKESIVIDIGAHIGTLSVPLARLAHTVIAFEPTAASFALLAMNTAREGLPIDVRNKGLGEGAGVASISERSEGNAGANSLTVGSGTVEISTLDSEVESADVIKIDVEGMELQVLRGSTGLLRKSQPAVLCEINLSALRAHQTAPRQIEEFMRAEGYRLYLPFRRASSLVLGSITNLEMLCACIAPRSWLFRTSSAPFDILALPEGYPLEIPHVSFVRTVLHAIGLNLKGKWLRLTGKGKKKKERAIRKVLTFRASSIGDCLMGKYLLENVRSQYPKARCGIVVAGKGALIKDLLHAYPWIEVIEANRRNPHSLFRLFREWRGSDLVVTQYAGKTGGSFSALSKIVARMLAWRGRLIGFTDVAQTLNRILYDILIPFNPDVAPAEHERRALRAAGFSVPLAYPMLAAESQASVRERHGIAGPFILVNLFSGSTKRGLSPLKRRELVAELRRELPQETVLVLTGGPHDRSAAAEAAGNDALLAVGASLSDTIALAREAQCVVSLDTGIGHIAAQLRAPLIVISTCMGLFWWGEDQYGKDIPAHLFSRPEHCTGGHILSEYPLCMNDFDVKAVAQAARELAKGRLS